MDNTNTNEKEMVNTTNPNVENVDYIKAINDLKQNSVSVDDYNKVVKENRQLLDSLTSNQQQVQQEVVPSEKELAARADELRASLYDSNSVGNLNNLQYWKNTLELRDIEMAQGKQDPFLPVGDKSPITPVDYETIENVVEGVKHCIEYCDGDSALFTQELQRIMTNR